MDYEYDQRRRVEQEVGHKISDNDWVLLVTFGAVTDQMDAEDVARAARSYLRMERALRETRPARADHQAPATEEGHERSQAFAEIVSHRASIDPDVVRWRSKFLQASYVPIR